MVYIYSCLYRYRSVSMSDSVEEMSDSVEENERTSPLLRCALAIVSFCVSSWRFVWLLSICQSV